MKSRVAPKPRSGKRRPRPIPRGERRSARSAGESGPPPVGVIGLGYVGLATALAFVEYGVRVVGMDLSRERRNELRHGECSISEPGLPELLTRSVRSGRFTVSDSVAEVAKRAELLFLCVPTPSRKDGSVDLSFVREASRSVGEALRTVTGWRSVVLKSTGVPGTTHDEVRPQVLAASGRVPEREVGFGANPEFLAEGSLVHDALHPSRIVLGADDPGTERLLVRAYQRFPGPRVHLSSTAAELVKYASNALLATKVSFSNEIARLATAVGVDVYPVLDAVGLDPRLGAQFLRAGPGFGGSCFGKDLRALIAFGDSKGVPLEIPRSVLAVNAAQASHVVDLADRAAGGLDGRRVAVLGLSFKADTNDTRESQAYPIVYELLRRGASVRLHDPIAAEPFRRGLDPAIVAGSHGRIGWAETVREALRGADLAVLQDDWDEYRRAPAAWWGELGLRLVVDARRSVDSTALEHAGIRYVAVGR